MAQFHSRTSDAHHATDDRCLNQKQPAEACHLPPWERATNEVKQPGGGVMAPDDEQHQRE
jgi:hypothetical protein